MMPGMLLSLLLLDVAPAPVVAPEEISVDLRYVTHEDLEGENVPPQLGGYAFLDHSFEPPGGDWKLPELKGEKPLFGWLSIGDAEVLCVFDKDDESTGFYDRVICDRNANRDLTDDEAALNEDSDSFNFFSTDPFDLEVPIGQERFAYRLELTAYCAGRIVDGEVSYEDESIRVYARSLCAYLGELEIGGRSYRILLADRQLNGRFDDLATFGNEEATSPESSARPGGDVLWIDGGKGGSYRDGSPLGSYLQLGERLFALSIDFPRKKLALSEYDGPVARIVLPAKPRRVCLAVGGGDDYLVAFDTGGTIPAPAGDCRLLWYQVYRKDEQGDEWYLAATATPRTEAVEARAGESVELALGEPFSSRALIYDSVYEAFEESGELEDARLYFYILGSGNERVGDIRHLSGSKTEIALDEDGEMPAEPGYSIYDEDGKQVARGAFRYG